MFYKSFAVFGEVLKGAAAMVMFPFFRFGFGEGDERGEGESDE